MQKFTLLLSDKQRNFLVKYAAKRDRSKGYILREIIDGKIENLEEDGGIRSENGN